MLNAGFTVPIAGGLYALPPPHVTVAKQALLSRAAESKLTNGQRFCIADQQVSRAPYQPIIAASRIELAVRLEILQS